MWRIKTDCTKVVADNTASCARWKMCWQASTRRVSESAGKTHHTWGLRAHWNTATINAVHWVNWARECSRTRKCSKMILLDVVTSQQIAMWRNKEGLAKGLAAGTPQKGQSDMNRNSQHRLNFLGCNQSRCARRKFLKWNLIKMCKENVSEKILRKFWRKKQGWLCRPNVWLDENLSIESSFWWHDFDMNKLSQDKKLKFARKLRFASTGESWNVVQCRLWFISTKFSERSEFTANLEVELSLTLSHWFRVAIVQTITH